MVIRLIVLLAAAISCAYGLFVIPEELNDLPTEFSWDNVNGSNYLPPVRNQWFPQPCNSGWAMAATNVINSRIKILRNAKWPDVQLSPQVLLDCDSLDYGCFGVHL
jgi:cathepsin X